jgi:hypothetical protein
LLAHWWCKGEPSYRTRDPDEYYLKVAFHPVESINYTGALIVIVSVSHNIYQNVKDKWSVNIRYAREDPLIIKIEGENL